MTISRAQSGVELFVGGVAHEVWFFSELELALKESSQLDAIFCDASCWCDDEMPVLNSEESCPIVLVRDSESNDQGSEFDSTVRTRVAKHGDILAVGMAFQEVFDLRLPVGGCSALLISIQEMMVREDSAQFGVVVCAQADDQSEATNDKNGVVRSSRVDFFRKLLSRQAFDRPRVSG